MMHGDHGKAQDELHRYFDYALDHQKVQAERNGS